jgi:N-acetylglucosamine-6-phosphate deacetylase
MVVRTKGVEKIILISDSTTTVSNYKNNEAEGIWYSPDLNYDDRGMLAGSRLTVDNACRNMMVHTGYGLCHAIRMATANPAKMLGIYETVGTLDIGKRANILIIDDEIRVKKVFLDGELMVENA